MIKSLINEFKGRVAIFNLYIIKLLNRRFFSEKEVLNIHTTSEQKYHESGRNIEKKLFECGE